MRKRLLSLSISCIVIAASFNTIEAQQKSDYVKRTNLNALMEPALGIISGAGQSSDAFAGYSNAMPKNLKPIIYMTYIGVDGKLMKWAKNVSEEINKYPWYIIPQVGLGMTYDGSPEKHYEDLVAEGKYDRQIDTLIMALNYIDRPMYIRIGYEFAGQWNGYKTESFKAAYIKITDVLKKGCNHPIATVWCMSVDAENKDYMSYYPGDSYVDWWGIDLFGAWQFNDSTARTFMDSSMTHKKPVMIGESTPRKVGVLQGDSSWIKWYAPYFAFIAKYPQIKAISYINWNWAAYPMWADWGNGRIEDNAIIKSKFINEMQNPIYIHGGSSKLTSKCLGIPDPKK